VCPRTRPRLPAHGAPLQLWRYTSIDSSELHFALVVHIPRVIQYSNRWGNCPSAAARGAAGARKTNACPAGEAGHAQERRKRRTSGGAGAAAPDGSVEAERPAAV